MSVILWTIAVIVLVNLALLVAMLVSPGRPERNTLRWAIRKGFVTRPEMDLRIMEAIDANEQRKTRAFRDALRKAFGGQR